MTAATSVRVLRWLCAVIFVCGIAGIIVSSINGNNAGWVISIGLTTSSAAVILIVVSTVTARQRIHVFDEVEAEQLEAQIAEQVQRGASEDALRDIVRRAIDLGRKTA
jgi:hypothetical protein